MPCWGPAIGPPNWPVQKRREAPGSAGPPWLDPQTHFTSYLVAGGIQVEQQPQELAEGTPQGLEEMAQGRVYPCPPWEGPPWEGPPWEGPPLACSRKATVEETFGATEGREASVADPYLEDGASGRAAGPQAGEGGRVQGLDLHRLGTKMT